MSKEFKELVEPSIVLFGFMLQEAVQDGWKISEQQPVNYFGGLYVVGMERGSKERTENNEGDTVGGDGVEVCADEPTVAKRGPKPKAK